MNAAKRLDELERVLGSSDEKKIWVLQFEQPGVSRAVTGYKCFESGQSWALTESESPEALRERASSEVVPNFWGVAVLLEQYGSEAA